MMMEHSINKLKAATIRQLKTQQPDEDFELIAKYVYARLAELNPDMKALPEGEYYANAEKGLRSFFVTKGKIRNFKEEGTLKPFIDEYLGFSLYMKNRDFAYYYFVEFADLLNKVNGMEYNSFFESKNNDYYDIFMKLDKIINQCFHVHNEIFLIKRKDDNIVHDEISFLFDTLSERTKILKYSKLLDKLFNQATSLFNKIKTDQTNTKSKLIFILYAIVFYGLKLLSNDFYNHWKNYYEFEKKKYPRLKDFASKFNHFLEQNMSDNSTDDNYKYLVLILLIHHISKSIDKTSKFGKEISANKTQLELTNPTKYFLYFLLGGSVEIPRDKKSYYEYGLSSIIETKLLMDASTFNKKLKNECVKDYYLKNILYIKRNKNKFKSGGASMIHLIYSFFSRAIEYYSIKEGGRSVTKVELFKYLCDYLPSDFIHGDIFTIYNDHVYNQENFFSKKIYTQYNNELSNISCFSDYFMQSDNSRYYKTNFIDRFMKYSYTKIAIKTEDMTQNGQRMENSERRGKECIYTKKQYKALIIESIENYCDSILSNRQPETPNSSH